MALTIRNTPSGVRPKPQWFFQPQNHAALFGFRQELFNAVDHPAKSVVIAVTCQPWLDAAVLHQLVKILARAPSPGVDPHRRNAEPKSALDRATRLLDILLAALRVGKDEALMRREPAQIEAIGKGPALELLQVGVVAVGHLHFEDFDAVEAHVGRFVDAGFDRRPLAAKVPEGIRRDGNAVASMRGRWQVAGRANTGSGRGQRNAADERSTIDRHRDLTAKRF